MTLLRVRAANALIGDSGVFLISAENAYDDYVSSLNLFVTVLMRAGVERVLVLTDVPGYARGPLADSLRSGAFVREDEVWNHGFDSIMVDGMGVVRSAPLDCAPNLNLAAHDAVVCALYDPDACLMLPGDEFARPGRYAVRAGEPGKSGYRVVRVHGQALHEPDEEEESLRAEERGADHASEAQEREASEALQGAELGYRLF